MRAVSSSTMLAYLFWHRPRDGVDSARYEDALRHFHAALEVPSATFRLRQLPFAEADGYEDWYAVEDWQALGDLNVVAVDQRRRDLHDRAAGLSGEGWGGVYDLVRGAAVPPPVARWMAKPDGRSYEEFLGSLAASTIWQRQLLLGPAPEFCLGQGTPDGRQQL